MSDTSAQAEQVRKESSIQALGCSKCPDPSRGAKGSPCTRCTQVEDLIHQVAKLQEIVKGYTVLEELRWR